MSGSDATKGDGGLEGLALARRAPEEAVARTMTVDLPPERVIEIVLGLDVMEPRSSRKESRFELLHHEGLVFYERTSEGLVLWRRPEPLVGRGYLHPIPYPDMIEARIEAAPRGSRVELRWRTHPLTRVAQRWEVGALAVVLVLLVIWPVVTHAVVLYEVIAMVLAASLLAGMTLWRHWRLSRRRGALRSVYRRACAALAPFELGRADLESSAFRASSGQREAARSGTDPGRG